MTIFLPSISTNGHTYIIYFKMNNISTQKLTNSFLSEGQLSSVYYGNENITMLNAMRNASKLISHFFAPINALASKPVFTVKSDSVIIHVFYYVPVKGHVINNNTINNLGQVLSNVFGKQVELRLVKHRYPYLNSYILAQWIANTTQSKKLVQIVRRLFSSVAPVKDTDNIETLTNALPSHIVGIKVRVSGRLMTERSRPRQTVQTAQIGSFSKGNLSLVDFASFTTKNKKGAFTVKVWISQRAVV
jgi:ribosomal protein S3